MKCQWPTCNAEAHHGIYCYMHLRATGGNTIARATTIQANKIKSRNLAKKSIKGIIEDKEYKKIVKAMLKENNLCEVKSPVCTKVAQGLHHIIKRSKFTLKEKSNLLRSCNYCNSWIEENTSEAKKIGLVKSKF